MNAFYLSLLPLFLLFALAIGPSVALAQVDRLPPPSLKELKSKRYSEGLKGLEGDLALDIRKDALEKAAMSYGARGGLAYRTFFIRKELEEKADYLDKVFDFRQLLIRAPSGFVIEPPIISEALDNIIVENDGQSAAVSDTIFNINRNARITTAARTWRQYLERDWGEIADPPLILLPRDDQERAIWERLVEQGWQEGLQQADDIFQEDLNRLTTDYEGMVRYRKLLAYNMISPPYALQVDRGVTGGGNEMRIGDRAVTITGKPSLLPGSNTWQPVSQ